MSSIENRIRKLEELKKQKQQEEEGPPDVYITIGGERFGDPKPDDYMSGPNDVVIVVGDPDEDEELEA